MINFDFDLAIVAHLSEVSQDLSDSVLSAGPLGIYNMSGEVL